MGRKALNTCGLGNFGSKVTYSASPSITVGSAESAGWVVAVASHNMHALTCDSCGALVCSYCRRFCRRCLRRCRRRHVGRCSRRAGSLMLLTRRDFPRRAAVLGRDGFSGCACHFLSQNCRWSLPLCRRIGIRSSWRCLGMPHIRHLCGVGAGYPAGVGGLVGRWRCEFQARCGWSARAAAPRRTPASVGAGAWATERAPPRVTHVVC